MSKSEYHINFHCVRVLSCKLCTPIQKKTTKKQNQPEAWLPVDEMIDNVANKGVTVLLKDMDPNHSYWSSHGAGELSTTTGGGGVSSALCFVKMPVESIAAYNKSCRRVTLMGFCPQVLPSLFQRTHYHQWSGGNYSYQCFEAESFVLVYSQFEQMQNWQSHHSEIQNSCMNVTLIWEKNQPRGDAKSTNPRVEHMASSCTSWGSQIA